MAKTVSFSEFELFQNARKNRKLVDLTLELTARCNNNCNHCYNNLPKNDPEAIKKELTTHEVKDIIDQAFDLGVIRVLLTGGEILLRKDFNDLYTYIKKKGFLVSIFTNATLITKAHIDLFKQYPPKSIEVTVYGTSDKEYAQMTKTKNFPLFKSGLDQLQDQPIPVILKFMVLKSNRSSLKKIKKFCKNNSSTPSRYDMILTARTDRDKNRNKKIIKERLSADEIMAVENQDSERLDALKKLATEVMTKTNDNRSSESIFQCGAGRLSCYITYDGFFRLCRPLVNSKCIYDLRKGSLKEAWETFVPKVLSMKSKKAAYKESCGICNIRDFCKWCPASADLETGELDSHVDYFCKLAKKRHAYCINSE